MLEIKFDQQMYNKIITSMKGIQKSEESLLKTAVNNTADKAQKLLARQAKKVYAGEAPKGILERSSIKKATVSKLSATILFKSEQPLLTKFRVTGEMPTKTVYRDGKRVKFPIKGTQMRSGRMKTLKGKNGLAFAVVFKNGTPAIVYRGKGSRKGYEGKTVLKAFYGSSDRSMVGNEKVYGRVNKDISNMLNEQCEKLLDKVLGEK